MISLIIPVYNEEATLPQLIDSLRKIPELKQLVFVNDASTDASSAILKKELEKEGSRSVVVNHRRKKGKGAAIRSGLKVVKEDLVFIQDADLEYDPKDLLALAGLLQAGEGEVAFGSRFIRKNKNIYKLNLLGNKLMTFVINSLGGGHFTDAYTCYKGMSTKKWRELNLKSRGFEIEAEICMKILKAKWTIKEIPISYTPRRIEEGKKIRAMDALKGILTILRHRFL